MASGKYYVYVEDNSGCIVGDTVEIADQARDTYYVSTTGSNSNTGTSSTDAFASIATAVDYACTNDTIILLDGTYTEDSIFVDKPVVIASEYILDSDTNHINSTILTGGQDAAFFINYVNGTYADTNSSQIVGFTIKNFTNPNTDQWYGHGGAISVWNSVVKIDRMKILNNTARYGGGLGFMGHGFTAVVTNSTIENNTATEEGGGIRAELTGDLYVRDTKISNNQANGAGGLWTRSRTYLSRVDIINNSAQSSGGFYARTFGQGTSGTSHKWSRVRITGNTANNDYGAGYFDKDNSNHFILENCLITDNTSYEKPGIEFRGYDATKISFVNTTVYNNLGSSSSAISNHNVGIWDNTVIRLLNSIIGQSGGSSGYAIYGHNCGTQYLMADSSSIIEGGVNAIYDNPCGSNVTELSISGVGTSGVYFNDASAGDYALSAVSNALGAALASNNLAFSDEGISGLTLTAPTTDLYGNPRPNPSGTNPDIGAIESPESAPQVGIAAVTTDNGFCQTTSGAITANLLNYTGTAIYSWSSSTYPTWTWNATQSAIGLSSGDYKVVAIDATSGAKIDSTEITIATLPSISITNTSTDVTCFGDDGAYV